MPSPSTPSSTASKSSIPLGHMNALKPTTPSSASSARRATLPGTSPPQSAKSVIAAPSAAATFRRNASASTVGGCAFSGMSTTHVVPPAAAAAVPLAQPSQSARPGSLKCTCASTAPGRTRRPVASTVSVAESPSSAPVATILPSSTATSTGSQPRIRRSTSATRLFSPAVPLQVMPSGFRVASTKRCKDAGSADSGTYRRDRGRGSAPRDRGPEADMYRLEGH